MFFNRRMTRGTAFVFILGFLRDGQARTSDLSAISSKTYSTRRGVTIGDSLSAVEKAYGHRKEWQKRKELNRDYEIYDTTFSDYDFLFDYEYRTGDYNARYIAFYFKNNRLVKIYLWRGLTD